MRSWARHCSWLLSALPLVAGCGEAASRDVALPQAAQADQVDQQLFAQMMAELTSADAARQARAIRSLPARARCPEPVVLRVETLAQSPDATVRAAAATFLAAP